jgi:hypothetical protein
LRAAVRAAFGAGFLTARAGFFDFLTMFKHPKWV